MELSAKTSRLSYKYLNIFLISTSKQLEQIKWLIFQSPNLIDSKFNKKIDIRLFYPFYVQSSQFQIKLHAFTFLFHNFACMPMHFIWKRIFISHVLKKHPKYTSQFLKSGSGITLFRTLSYPVWWILCVTLWSSTY